MTAEEIRKYAADDRNLHTVGERIILAEIAAQLAELNEHMRKAVRVDIVSGGPGSCA